MATKMFKSESRNQAKFFSKIAAALLVGATTLLGFGNTAEAQEIQLTGPLAGAPAVKNLRLYRKGRLELSPNVSFSLLDQYRRQAFIGLRANYGLADWLAIGVWGGVSSSMAGLHLDTSLTSNLQEVNANRNCAANMQSSDDNYTECLLTEVNLGKDFKEQVASLDWMVSPQITAVPFRGKLGLFNDIFVDADLYVFAGPAFIGLRERSECQAGSCAAAGRSFGTESRVAIAPTFGLGFTFFLSRWTALGAEYRAFPFSWNAAGFDVAGGGKDNAFPDGAITSADREFQFNQMLTLSFNMYLPFDHQVSQ